MQKMNEGGGAASMMDQLRRDILRAMPQAAEQAGIPISDKQPVPVDVETESREQIEHLLDQYLQAHQADLEADLDKHGDPRRQPGFTRERREVELDALRARDADRSLQRDEAMTLQDVLDKLEKQLVKNPKTSTETVRHSRRTILDGIKIFGHRPADKLLPAMRQWVERANRFIEQYPAIFHPQPINDPTLLARLQELGPYEVETSKSSVNIHWDRPNSLACDWTTFGLEIEFTAGDAGGIDATARSN